MDSMRGILDFSKPLDVALFDKVVSTFYSSTGTPEQQAASQVMAEFQANANAWTQVGAILQGATQMASKFIALKTLDATINTRWNLLPEDQRRGVRNFIINMIVDLSSTKEKLQANHVLLGKLNHTLVQILKKDWPQHWPTFIRELVESAKASDSLMQNNLAILKELSEEVFDFSRGEMTQEQTRLRKEALNKEFSMIFEMINFVLLTKSDGNMVVQALQCLLSFLSWIPLGYIFETDMIELLVTKFFPSKVTQTMACKCLTEIGSLTIPDEQKAYEQRFVGLYVFFLQQLTSIIPVQPPCTHEQIIPAYHSNCDEEFVQCITQFFVNFFRTHLPLLECCAANDASMQAAIVEGHKYLVGISHVDDKEVFKTCVEYWCWLSENVYNTLRDAAKGPSSGYITQWCPHPRASLFFPIFSMVRKVLIKKMARPEEVIIFEDENGEIVKERMKDVDALALYSTMREALIFLTHLDCDDTEMLMKQGLLEQNNASQWSASTLATLSWAIGSISGAMSQEVEHHFLVFVIKDLIELCDDPSKGKPDKASIASDIMYIVGQYPRFLKSHWRFLRTVILKLFYFMHETFEGVQDMAVETFLKIAHSCKEKFVISHDDEEPFINTLLKNIMYHTSDLRTEQIHIFYEATGHMINAAPREAQEELVRQFMAAPNSAWSLIVQASQQDPTYLSRLETMKEIAHVLKTCVCGAVSVGDGFGSQIYYLFPDLMNVYMYYSQQISSEVAAKGPAVIRYTHVRHMRIVKKESLRLLEEYIKRITVLQHQMVLGTLVPPLLETVLTDYNKSVQEARDPQVLSLMTSLIETLKGGMEAHVPAILDATLSVTLQMITANMQDHPEHRRHFFRLLKAVNRHCFKMFLSALQMSRSIMDAIVWAFKHQDREVEETGLEITLEFLQSISSSSIALDFYQAYYINLLNDVFVVLTDTMHKTGFKLHCQLLRHMVNTAVMASEAGRSIAPDQPQGMRADQFVKNHLGSQLAAFQNLTQLQINRFVEGMFTKKDDQKAFKEHIRDFLVELREFASLDNTELYDDAREADAAAKKAEQEKRQMMVPGLAPTPSVQQVMASRGGDEDIAE